MAGKEDVKERLVVEEEQIEVEGVVMVQMESLDDGEDEIDLNLREQVDKTKAVWRTASFQLKLVKKFILKFRLIESTACRLHFT